MKRFLSRVALALAFALPAAVFAQTSGTPIITFLRSGDFSAVGYLGAYGRDGRLHGYASPDFWSMRPDGSDYRVRTVDEAGFTVFAYSPWVENSQGVFTIVAGPLSFDGSPPSADTCPTQQVLRDEGGNPVFDPVTGNPVFQYHYARLARLSATGQPAILPISGTFSLCPRPGMTIDAQGNVYFLAQSQDANHQPEDGLGLYRLAADGQSLNLVRRFPAAEGTPRALLAGQDGQWLYGTNIAAAGTQIFRLRLSDAQFEVMHTLASSEGTESTSGQPGQLVELGDYVYGVMFGGGTGSAGGNGTLVRIRKDGAGDSFRMLHQFARTDGRRPNGLVLGADGNPYGTTSAGGTTSSGGTASGTVFRIVVANISDSASGVEAGLYNFSGADPDGQSPGSLIAGRDGKFYGSSTTGVFALDFGIVLPLPVVNLSSSAPEVVWTGTAGQQGSTLTWEAQNALSCSASGDWSGTKALSGSETVIPLHEGDNVYTLECVNGAGAAQTASITVKAVAPPPVPVLNFSASASSAQMGSTVTLSWQAANTLSCTASGAWTGSKALDADGRGSETITLPNSDTVTTRTYTLSCTGAGGTVSQDVAVTATVPPGEQSGLHVGGGGGALSGGLLALLALIVPLAIRKRGCRTAQTGITAPPRAGGQ